MSVITITKDNFRQEVVESDKPVLLDFWADWCGPCQMMGPVVDEIAGERPDIKVGKVNVTEQQELAAAFQIMSIPALMVFQDGKVVPRSRSSPCCHSQKAPPAGTSGGRNRALPAYLPHRRASPASSVSVTWPRDSSTQPSL